MIQFNNFTEEELSNALLVILKQFEFNPPFRAQNGITSEIISSEMKLDPNVINPIIVHLYSEGLISAEKQDNGAFIHCRCSEKTNQLFTNFEKRPLTEIALLILQKTYEWYQRNNYQTDTQENSLLISAALGITNHEKVKSAITMLISNGLLRKWVIMRDFISFCITIEGVNFMEEPKMKEENIAPIIIHGNQGNISISSNNVTQTISKNELDNLFTSLEETINSKVDEALRENAIDDLETVKELVKSEKPKINLITRILDNLKNIPVLVEGVNSIVQIINEIPK
jgi:predicted transcriptional regulator